MHPALTEHQAQIVARVLAEESARRSHLVIHLSGAHAYGFPSHDSDIDLKAVHIDPTERLLGLRTSNTTANRLEVIEGVEIDYTSNELLICVKGLLGGDGNMLERVTASVPVQADDDTLASLRELVPGSLSRAYHRHYRGFAGGQQKRLKSAAPTAKQLLYVLRTSLTGAHLLRERECEPNLLKLWERYGFGEVPELVELKQQAEGGLLDAAWAARVDGLIARADAALDDALAVSPLPEAADPRPLEDWLIEQRRRRLD